MRRRTHYLARNDRRVAVSLSLDGSRDTLTHPADVEKLRR